MPVFLLYPIIVPILIGVLAISVILLIFSKPWKYISPISKMSLYALIVIICAGVFFRFQQPLNHQIFYDEDHYLQEGKEMSEGKIVVDNAALKLKKIGYHLLLAIVFLVSPESAETPAFLFNIILGILTIPLIYLVARELWGESGALFSAALIAFLPEHVRWSATTSLDVPAIFFIVATLLVFFIFLRTKNFNHFLLSFFIAIYLSFMRPEMIIFAGMELLYFLYDRKLLATLLNTFYARSMSMLALALFLLSSLVTLSSLNYWQKVWRSAGGAQATKGAFSLDYFIYNIQGIFNYNFKIANLLFFIVVLAAFWGIYSLYKKEEINKPGLAVSFIALILFFYYNFYSYGGYWIGNLTQSRFAAIWLCLFIVIAGGVLAQFLHKVFPRKYITASAIIFVIFSLQLQFNLQEFFPPPNQNWAIKERQYMLVFAKENPECLYVSTAPYFLSFHGYKTMREEIFLNPKTIFYQAPKCIIYLKSEGCSHIKGKECASIANKFNNWEELATEPAALYFYSPKNIYQATIPEFNLKVPPSTFDLIKSKI